jgi:DNA-binding transcriptional ArsR family regulator
MIDAMPRPPIHFVVNPKVWAVLTAPVRLEIVEAMRMIAPCSIADVAAALDRPADALYRHIEKLKRAGLVLDAGERPCGRRTERLYDLIADDFRVGFRNTSQRTANKAFNDTIQSILKIASRTARDAASAGVLEGMGDDRNVIGKVEHAWLTREEFHTVRAMMMGIKEYIDSRKGRRDGRLYLAAFLALPVTRKRGAKARVEAGTKKDGVPRAGKRVPRTRAGRHAGEG